jgi:hypothetical protein
VSCKNTSSLVLHNSFASLSCSQHRIDNRRHSELRQKEKEIRAEFVYNEVSKRKQEVMDGFEKTREVMKNWVGVSTEEIFNCWRGCAGLSRKILRKEHRERGRDARLRYEDELAAYELEKLELKKWEQHWDEFNDVPIWVNTESNESIYEKPNPPQYPLVLASLVDPTTGKSLSPDSSSDDDSACTYNLSQEDDKSASPPLLGREAEIELAKKHVEDMRRCGHVSRKII